MNRITILILEDEPEVRAGLRRDLEPFAAAFRLEFAEDAAEAREVITECREAGDPVGLILCDHLLPGMHGTDLLIELESEGRLGRMRKVLVTGQAGLDDTIRAVNEAGLDHFIAKPWNPQYLRSVVRDQLTGYVIETTDDLARYLSVLDGPRLLEEIARRGWDR